MQQLFIATAKGAFRFTADASRGDWSLSDPMIPGWEVSALHRMDDGRLLIGTTHFAYGATIRVSDDDGKSFREVATQPKYAAESGRKSKRIWQICGASDPANPDRVYCGLDEAGLFVSDDRGENWREVAGLTRGRNPKDWMPGGGGLCLHTIVIDPRNPKRMWIAISAVGCFRSIDGGETWIESNAGLPVMPTGVESTPTCACVHKVVLDPRDASGNTLFMQFHGGVLKSTDGAASWTTIENGLPSNFGFPISASRAGELFVVPLTSDEKRFMPDGKFRVFKSSDAGESWTAKTKGLPSDAQYVGVLRDAMSVDAHDPAGVYVGTTMGEVFASADAGESWMKLPGTFPRIETVRVY